VVVEEINEKQTYIGRPLLRRRQRERVICLFRRRQHIFTENKFSVDDDVT